MNCYFWLASFSTAVPAAARSLFMMTAVEAATRCATVVVAVVVVVSLVVAFVFSAEGGRRRSVKSANAGKANSNSFAVLHL